MASTSTSYVQKSFKYDVFLSFRGEDTRNNFVSHLYKALEQNGIQTYKDDKKIQKGETIDTQLMKSIEDSRFFIIVFSKNYASSSWCLDELVKIMECQKTSEQTVYPVFYDVEPTEIRKQSGPVKEAFKKHKNKEAARKWRKALNEAGNLAGWESNGDESKLIQEIVDDIFEKKCSSSSSVDGSLVGMETRVEDVLSSLELEVDEVRMIGIWGIGGGGKTTLAKAVFDRIAYQFEGKTFVENPFPNLRFLKFYKSWQLRSLDLSVAPNLDTLILENSPFLVEVLFQVTPNIKELRITSCVLFEKLHMPAESPKLTSVYLKDLPQLRTLQLGITPNLETLSLKRCIDMVELAIPAECPKLRSLNLEDLPKLRTLHLGITPNLEDLSLRACTDMVELRIPDECPKLTSLYLEGLQKLRTLHIGITPNLDKLSLKGCIDMVELGIPVECPKLRSLYLKDLQKLRTLHLEITPNLEDLSLSACTDMIELRIPAECPKLTSLDLYDLQKLRTLHLGITPNLEILSLINCYDMVELRIPAECPKLRYLSLSNSIQRVALPEEFGRLECLEELDITGTGISRLPESIYRLKGLRIYGSRELLESYGFTPQIEINFDETYYYIDIEP